MYGARTLPIVLLMTALLAATQLTGCSRITSERVRTTSENSTISDAGKMDELSPAQAKELSEVLSGEIQTVYPSDAGLARVYGQVANLGDKPYEGVRFDVVVRASDSEGEGEIVKTVGTFSVSDGLAPGDIKSFDVQTTAPMGDVKSLVVIVGAVR